jgi:prevent-host-death family protein
MEAFEESLPIDELSARGASALRRLREMGRPIVITDDGKPAAVLITPEEFERTREYRRVRAAIREGLADSEAGRLIDDDELEAELDAEFGPLEPR